MREKTSCTKQLSSLFSVSKMPTKKESTSKCLLCQRSSSRDLSEEQSLLASRTLRECLLHLLDMSDEGEPCKSQEGLPLSIAESVGALDKLMKSENYSNWELRPLSEEDLMHANDIRRVIYGMKKRVVAEFVKEASKSCKVFKKYDGSIRSIFNGIKKLETKLEGSPEETADLICKLEDKLKRTLTDKSICDLKRQYSHVPMVQVGKASKRLKHDILKKLLEQMKLECDIIQRKERELKDVFRVLAHIECCWIRKDLGVTEQTRKEEKDEHIRSSDSETLRRNKNR